MQTSAEKAAVLLLSLGEEKAAKILKYMRPEQVRAISDAMTALENISQSDLEKVVKEFLKDSSKQTSLSMSKDGYIERVLTKNASGVLDKIKWMDAKLIAEIIDKEHPQIIAILLTYLDPDKAAEVIEHMPKERRADLLLRMATLDSIQPTALEELNGIMEKQFVVTSTGKPTERGGVKTVADIMNIMAGSSEFDVMDEIRTRNEDLATDIEDLMFIFEDFLSVDDRDMQTVLRDVPQDVLIIALKGAEPKVADKFFNNMSKRAADLLKDDMEAKGPVKVSEVEAAQKEVMNIARKLAEDGEINMGAGGGGEEMIG